MILFRDVASNARIIGFARVLCHDDAEIPRTALNYRKVHHKTTAPKNCRYIIRTRQQNLFESFFSCSTAALDSRDTKYFNTQRRVPWSSPRHIICGHISTLHLQGGQDTTLSGLVPDCKPESPTCRKGPLSPPSVKKVVVSPPKRSVSHTQNGGYLNVKC